MKQKSIENTYMLFNDVAKSIRHDIIRYSRHCTKEEITAKKEALKEALKLRDECKKIN